LTVFNHGSVSTNVYLRRTHNFAIGMHCLPWPALPKLQWPTVKFKEKRAITIAEHARIIDRERNPELRAFYELLWQLGRSQSYVANLTAEDIHWPDRTILFQRCKTKVPVVITFGPEAAAVLQSLPRFGLLFPWLSLT
jgi:integrase